MVESMTPCQGAEVVVLELGSNPVCLTVLVSSGVKLLHRIRRERVANETQSIKLLYALDINVSDKMLKC